MVFNKMRNSDSNAEKEFVCPSRADVNTSQKIAGGGRTRNPFPIFTQCPVLALLFNVIPKLLFLNTCKKIGKLPKPNLVKQNGALKTKVNVYTATKEIKIFESTHSNRREQFSCLIEGHYFMSSSILCIAITKVTV